MTHVARRAPRPTRSLTGMLAALAVAVLAPISASGQETSGKPVLLEAVEAAKALTSLKADVELSGAGGFADWVPTGKGTIRLAKGDSVPTTDAQNPGDRPASAWYTRVDTSYTHKKGEQTHEVVILQTPEALIWIDHENESVEERSTSDRRSEFRSIPELFGLPEVTSPEPYSRELRTAISWESLGTQEVNGVECEVVLVRYDLTKDQSPRGGSMTRTPTTKWFFGADDHLPRRIERITDQGGISFTIVEDIRNLEANPGIDPAELAIETPPGYTRTARNRPARVESPGVKPQSPEQPGNPGQQNADLPAHGFELIDGDGNTVTLESLKGNVAVLYFWGTWCLPCKEYSPLVSGLVDTFEGEPVRVFGLPVRERTEEAVREAMAGYKHTLLLNPGGKPVGCDETARAYKVRGYPTIVVIGKESELLAVRTPTADSTAEQTIAQIEKTIRDHLASAD